MLPPVKSNPATPGAGDSRNRDFTRSYFVAFFVIKSFLKLE
jgi:hypothetical protein